MTKQKSTEPAKPAALDDDSLDQIEGGAKSAVQKALKPAEKDVLFFDEADAIFGRKNR